MQGLVSQLWILIILWGGFGVYTKYEEHNVALESSRAEVPDLEAKISKKQKEKKDLQNYFSDIEEAKTKIEKVASEIERLQQQFPSEISDTDNLALISSIAESLNIKQIFLSPGIESNKGFYFSKLYKVKASGTYLQILIFLEKIAEAKRLLNVYDAQLVKIDKRQKGRFQLIDTELNLEVYKYNPTHKEERGIENIVKPSDEPPKRKRRNRNNPEE